MKKAAVKKKPAAKASPATLRRPAAAVDDHADGRPLKVRKYLYKADQKYGIKVNDSEKMTVES